MSNERIALHNLWQRTDVAIKPADKGSAVVGFSKEDYIDEVERQLNNHAHYIRLNTDPTPRSTAGIKSFIHSMFANRQIDKYTREILIPHRPWVARFYLLPKIHKPGNPCRPTVTLNSALTENISLLVDWFHNCSQPLFHHTSGTLPTLSTGSKGYHYYLQQPC